MFEAAGSTYRVAQRLSAAFTVRTGRLVAKSRNISLTGDELGGGPPIDQSSFKTRR